MKKVFNGIYKLKPIIHQALWGGYKLSSQLGEDLFISELWEYVNIPSCSNQIYDFNNEININHFIQSSDFPIIIKILNTEANLSIQVHPDKTEMLYIIECCGDAKIGLGLKRDALQNIKEIIDNKTICTYMHYFNVVKGSVVYIPAGLIHTYGSGIVAIEIQNNSTETYRLYDFDRIINGQKRELHISQAINVLNNNFAQDSYYKQEKHNSKFELLFSCKHFDVYKLAINRESIKIFKKHLHCSLVCIRGEGNVNCCNIKELDSMFVMPEHEILEFNSNTLLEIIITTKHVKHTDRLITL